ncbi:MAG TPA: calcium/sodium antiporter [Thermoanaerobaculia bacterium]
MLLQSLFFGLGLVGLYYTAEWLVKGASRIAWTLGMTPVVVGLTVVAFGTSAPELVVSSVAAVKGQGDVSMGNVVGSNIMNIALILGVCAIIKAIHVDRSFIRREIPIVIATALLLPLIGWDGIISRIEAIALLAAFVLFIHSSLRAAKKEPPGVDDQFREYEEASGYGAEKEGKLWLNIGLVVAGVVGLVVSAHLLVTSAVFFAHALGVSELVIGLTIIAVGTSLPEMATSIVAARRNEPEIAFGNVIGSNIFNVLLILGAAAAIRPISVNPSLLRFEIPISIVASLALVPLVYPRRRLGRFGGALLLVLYVAFTVVLLLNARTGA